MTRLRKRKGIEKKLVEELIPIARYVQARYREGRRLKVRWLSGSQPYDAVLWSSGLIVAHRCAPRKVLLEVTVLIIQCFCNTLTLETEWEDAMNTVKAAAPTIPFREVFLIESVNSYTKALYGSKPKAAKRKRA